MHIEVLWNLQRQRDKVLELFRHDTDRERDRSPMRIQKRRVTRSKTDRQLFIQVGLSRDNCHDWFDLEICGIQVVDFEGLQSQN